MSVDEKGVKTTRGYTATYDGNDYPYTGNPNADTLALTGNAYATDGVLKKAGKLRIFVHRRGLGTFSSTLAPTAPKERAFTWMTQDEFVKHVLDRIQRVGPSRSSAKFVAISGMDCAGKSTLALDVQDGLVNSGICVTRISIDRFLIPLEAKSRRAPEFMGYFEDAFDYQALINQLQTVSGSSQIVLVEGVFLLRQELRHWWDLALWLEVDPALALERALIRDLAYFGDETTVRRVYETRCAPAQSHHLQRDEPLAHAHIVASFRAGFWSMH